jgi:hypothetical protein
METKNTTNNNGAENKTAAEEVIYVFKDVYNNRSEELYRNLWKELDKAVSEEVGKVWNKDWDETTTITTKKTNKVVNFVRRHKRSVAFIGSLITGLAVSAAVCALTKTCKHDANDNKEETI